MEAFAGAFSQDQAVRKQMRLCSAAESSLAALVAVKRSDASVALGMDLLEAGRFLRIQATGRVDLAGQKTGPWTELKVASCDGGTFALQGVKSGRWLTIAGGQFVSTDSPEPLRLQVEEENSSSEVPLQIQAAETEVRLRIVHGDSFLRWPVRICENSGNVVLATQSGNVACGPEGAFHDRGKLGRWAQWELQREPAGISLKNVGHNKYLALSDSNAPVLADAPVLWLVEQVPEEVPMSLPPVDEAVLTAADRHFFKENGYIVLRNAVPPELIRDALRGINHKLGKPNCWEVDSNPLIAAQLNLRLSPEGVGSDIVNKSPAFWSALNILLGKGNVAPWRRAQQVALRFPKPPEEGHLVPDVKPGTRYHIDGMGQNKLCPFSLLCGVALSDQSRPNCGNLHVFPGSHLNEELHRYYLELIDDDGQGEEDDNKPDLGNSVQVLLNPGDVVIAHQMLAHRVGNNTSEHIRYQLYYRVVHMQHKELYKRVPREPWVEFAI